MTGFSDVSDSAFDDIERQVMKDFVIMIVILYEILEHNKSFCSWFLVVSLLPVCIFETLIIYK